MSQSEKTVRMFRVYINAPIAKVWEAITSPELNDKYGYHAPGNYELEAGGKYEAVPSADMKAMGLTMDVMIDGEVLEVDPPNRLVHTYRFLFDDAGREEGFSTLTWELFAESETLTKLTLQHDTTGMPLMDAQILGGSKKVVEGAGGWPWILSDLKTFLERGSSIAIH